MKNVAGKGFGSPSQTKGILRGSDTGKVIDAEWLTQNTPYDSGRYLRFSNDALGCQVCARNGDDSPSWRQMAENRDVLVLRAHPSVCRRWHVNRAWLARGDVGNSDRTVGWPSIIAFRPACSKW